MAPKRRGRRRKFTIEEANASLPLVRAIASDLSELSCDVGERRRRLSELLDGREPDDNSPYREELDHIARELDRDTRRLQEYVTELRELGVEPTDASEGLVDFPTVIDGQPACLCWKLGEPEVLYWHERGAGYEGRQPLAAGSVADDGLADEHGSEP